MTVEYAFLDAIIRDARTVVQYDSIVSEVMVSGVVTIDPNNGLSQTLFVDDNVTTLIILPLKLPIAQTSAMFRLFLQHDDPANTIGSFEGIDGYFGDPPVVSTTANARDVLAISYDNGLYGSVWGMFTQGTPV